MGSDKKFNTKWTLEKCAEIALKFNSRSEWQKQDRNSYIAAWDNNWLEQCCGHMTSLKKPNGYWNLERCLEIAKQYTYKTAWKNAHVASYDSAYKNSWFDICCAHMENRKGRRPKLKHTKEECLASALKYDTISVWAQHHKNHYSFARKHNFLQECTTHMINMGGKSFPERCLYHSLLQYIPHPINGKNFSVPQPSQFKFFQIDIFDPILNKGIEFNGAYWHSDKHIRSSGLNGRECTQAKLEFFQQQNIPILTITEQEWSTDPHGCINRCLVFLSAHKYTQPQHAILTPPLCPYKTKEDCIQSTVGHDSYTSWLKEAPEAYQVARNNDWLNDCKAVLPDIQPRSSRTLEECQCIAKKYNSPKEWENDDPASYNYTIAHKWMPQCDSHMQRQLAPKNTWTFENCLREAKKHSTIKSWRESGNGSYAACHEAGWMDKIKEQHTFQSVPKKPAEFDRPQWMQNYCKDYYQENKEQIKDNSANYRQNNADKVKAAQKAHYEANKEQRKAAAKARYWAKKSNQP